MSLRRSCLLVTELITAASRSIPGKYLVESLPILLKLPNFLTPWRTLAFEHRKKDVELYLGLVNEVKEKMERGVAPYSFAKQLIENQEKFGMTDLEVAYTCSTCVANPDSSYDTSADEQKWRQPLRRWRRDLLRHSPLLLPCVRPRGRDLHRKGTGRARPRRRLGSPAHLR